MSNRKAALQTIGTSVKDSNARKYLDRIEHGKSNMSLAIAIYKAKSLFYFLDGDKIYGRVNIITR